MKKNEFLIDTDVFIDHLYHTSEDISLLEKLMTKGLCFTTVLNAAELIYTYPHKSIIIDLLNAIKVLGIHPKYSVNTDKFKGLKNYTYALFCATAEMNKLPIVCLNKEKYINSGLEIFIPQDIT